MIQDTIDVTPDAEVEAIVRVEQQARRIQLAASLSTIVFIGGLLATLGFMLIWLFFAQEYIQLFLYGISMVPLTVVGWLYPTFRQRSRSKLGIILLMASILLTLIVAPICIPQLLPVASLGYMIVITMTMLLTSARDGLWLIIVTALTFPVEIVVVNEWGPDLFANPLGETLALVASVVVGFFAFVLVVLIVRMVVMGQEEQFKRAQMANLIIEKRASEEQEAKMRLESTVSEYMSFVQKVTEGDLSNRLEFASNGLVVNEADDLYVLGWNLNVMVESLAEMAAQVREAAGAVASAATEIQAAASQQVTTATQQDAAVTETVATVDEVRATVVQTAERAQTVADSSQESVDVSRAGEDAVASSIEGMKLIQQRVESIAETILMLSERTQQIGEIIDTVNSLADQSKLLALNASIEAARAGEEGKGFAVVAMEVRQLAEQSREATSRVRDILSDIQKATNTAVMVTEEGSKGADAGMELVERAGAAIQELAKTLEDAAQAAMQIAASTHQQTNGMDQLATAMMQIKQASAQTAAGMKQTEQSVRDLMEMAHQLEQAASRYELALA